MKTAKLLGALFIAFLVGALGARADEPIPGGAGREIVSVGNSVKIEPGQEVESVAVIRGDLTINGTIKQGIFVIGGHVELGPDARIGQGLFVLGGNVRGAAGARIVGDLTILGGQLQADSESPLSDGKVVVFAATAPFTLLGDWFRDGMLWGRPLPHQLVWVWCIAAIFLVINLLLGALFPGPIERCLGNLERRPLTSFVVGMLVLLVLAPLFCLLVLVIVGIPVLPILLCSASAAYLFGRVALYRYAGQTLLRNFGLTHLSAKILPSIAAGTLLLYLFYTIPFIGMLVWGLVTPLGLGSVVLTLGERFRRENPGTARESKVGTLALPNLFAGYDPAGFWIRLAANLIDFLLVAAVMGIFQIQQGVPLWWFIYHLVLWRTTGSTVGGRVFGLRIVRLDGKPFDLGCCVIRFLAAILSGLALFLGFFWAGWDRNKRSWHDHVAGTTVLRLPAVSFVQLTQTNAE